MSCWASDKQACEAAGVDERPDRNPGPAHAPYPIDGLRNPVDGLRDPGEGPLNPIDGLRDPIDDLCNPIDDLRNPIDDLGNPIDGPRDPGDDLWSPVDGSRDPIDGVEATISALVAPAPGMTKPQPLSPLRPRALAGASDAFSYAKGKVDRADAQASNPLAEYRQWAQGSSS